MKQLLRTIFLTLIAVAFGHSFAQAQTLTQRPAVAFEKADRSILYVKQPDSTVQSYNFAALDPNDIDSVRHLAILGMTPDGKRVFIAASVGYLNPSNSRHEVLTGLFNISLDLTQNALFTGGIKVLLLGPYGTQSFRPVGTLSTDGTQWWAAFISSAQNLPLRFYHGNMDATGSVDSAEVTATVAGRQAELQGGYHLSNISVDPSNNVMLAASVDGLDDQTNSGRALLYNWVLNGAFGQLSGTDFTGALKGLKPGTGNIDSLFGLTVHAVGDGNNVDIGLTSIPPDLDNTIDFFRTRYTASSVILTTVACTIPRSAIPDSMNFFAGINSGLYQENNNAASQFGQGGDVSFSSTRDTAVFITHESPDNATIRGPRSAIYMYDLNTGIATLIYNDLAAQELQPVFVTMPYLVPPITLYPGITATPSVLTFPTIDTGTTESRNITVTDTSALDVIVDSVKITGSNASQFTTSATFPQTAIKNNGTLTIPITFAPVGLAGSRHATATIYFAGSVDSIRQVQLSGSASVKSGGGVREDPALAMNMSVMPNPFSTLATVSLTAPETGALGITIHDALGRKVYTSDVRIAGAGATETFVFNAESLGLPNGVYYVTALFGDRQVSRQVVFIH